MSSSISGPVWLDGGLATCLAEHHPGLRPDQAITAAPGALLACHRAFAEAGAERLLTATLLLLPHREPHAIARIGASVRLASSASATAKVLLSLGPADLPGTSWAQASEAERSAWVCATCEAAEAGLAAGAAGIILETQVHTYAAERITRELKLLQPGFLAVSLVPDARGRTLDGLRPDDALAALLLAGADAVGFNCGARPEDVALAIAQVTLDAPLWAKPAGGPNFAATVTALRTRCAYLGGCCGVSPADLREVRWA